jgi:hypothetical protein
MGIFGLIEFEVKALQVVIGVGIAVIVFLADAGYRSRVRQSEQEGGAPGLDNSQWECSNCLGSVAVEERQCPHCKSMLGEDKQFMARRR